MKHRHKDRHKARRTRVRSKFGIKHCTKCKEGRLVTLKRPVSHEPYTFCGFCGYEPKI